MTDRRWRLSPRATLEHGFARRPGPFGLVAPDTSLPISLFVPPGQLGVLQRLAGTLREAWRTMVTAAISRERLPERGPCLAILDAIVRELAAEPAVARVLRIATDAPLRLEPVAPLQEATIQYPLERLALFGDRSPAFLAAPPVRVVLAPGGPPVARVSTLLGQLVAGMTGDELRAVTEPVLTQLVGSLQLAGLLVDSPTPAARALAPGTVEHLGHATLLANLGGAYVLVDPWLPPASAGDTQAPPEIANLPALAGIFITHHHWDHVHPDTLLRLPKTTPVYVPAQAPEAALRPHTEALLAYLGFTTIRTLAPGDAIAIGDGGEVVAAPFYGEDPTRLRYRGCCYVLRHAGASALVHVDSSADVDGRSLASTGDAAALVARFGPLEPVFATRRQERGLAIDHTWEYLLQPASTWLAPTENCHNDAALLAELARATGTRTLVLYSEGGADWYPGGTDFLRRATPTARAAPFEYLWDSLATITTAVAEASGARIALAAPFDRFTIGGAPASGARS